MAPRNSSSTYVRNPTAPPPGNSATTTTTRSSRGGEINVHYYPRRHARAELFIDAASASSVGSRWRIILLLLFLLPSDNVQHDLQHGSLITFPKEENLGNKRTPMHLVYLPSVPTFSLSTLFAVCSSNIVDKQHSWQSIVNPHTHKWSTVVVLTTSQPGISWNTENLTCTRNR